MRCMAPIKRNGPRQYENVTVVWVSRDGRVVEVVAKGDKRQGFACSDLVRPGTTSPPNGVVI
jgi:hypothetical protein